MKKIFGDALDLKLIWNDNDDIVSYRFRIIMLNILNNCFSYAFLFILLIFVKPK